MGAGKQVEAGGGKRKGEEPTGRAGPLNHAHCKSRNWRSAGSLLQLRGRRAESIPGAACPEGRYRAGTQRVAQYRLQFDGKVPRRPRNRSVRWRYAAVAERRRGCACGRREYGEQGCGMGAVRSVKPAPGRKAEIRHEKDCRPTACFRQQPRRKRRDFAAAACRYYAGSDEEPFRRWQVDHRANAEHGQYASEFRFGWCARRFEPCNAWRDCRRQRVY